MDQEPVGEGPSLALLLKAAEGRRRADPLARYVFASPTHRRAAEFFGRGIEVHHRAGNYGAKTGSAAAIVAALLRDLGKLGCGTLEKDSRYGTARLVPHAGIQLPKFGRPTVGAILVQSYDGQVDSSQKWLLDHIGDVPHRASYVNRGKNVIGTLWVKPDGHRSDDPQTWSRVTFFSQEAKDEGSIKGQRWDFVWPDEPPLERFWREARKNARYRIITDTPIHEPEWGWLLKDFDGCLGEPVSGRVELVSSLYDNGHLTPETIRGKEDEYRGDPHIRARLFGEYVNIDGSCPFDGPRLAQLLEWADPGEEFEPDPRVITWRDREDDEDYLVILEPSAGIRPTMGNPGGNACAMWVVAVRAKALVARYYGWLAPHLLARMGRKAGEYYNTALIVPEVNGLGEAMLPELDGYPNVFREFQLDRADLALSGRVGWYQSEQSKGAIVGSLIRSLLDCSLDIPCADAVRSLMAIRYDARGKLARLLNQNHEDMICAGMASYILAHPAYQPAVRYLDRKPKSLTDQFEQALSRSVGRRVNPVSGNSSPDRWR